MASSSSAHKVAKLASRGRGKRVRFQGGTTFPTVIGLVALIGLGLIIYGKASLPDDGGGAPTIANKWVAAYGFNVCNEDGTNTWLPNLTGKLDETTQDDQGQTVLLNKGYASTGVNSDNDGLIHWFPINAKDGRSLATGRRAKLGVFLDNYGVGLSDTVLTIPGDDHGPYDVSKMTCAGDKPVLKVRYWSSAEAPGTYRECVTDCRNLHIDRNGMAFSIAIVPKDNRTEIELPPSAADMVAKAAAVGADPIPGADLPLPTQPGSVPASAPSIPATSVLPASSSPAPAPASTTVPAASTTQA